MDTNDNLTKEEIIELLQRDDIFIKWNEDGSLSVKHKIKDLSFLTALKVKIPN